MNRPKVGARSVDEYNGRVIQWTGDAWASVCPQDDIPMADHDGQGWLCCAACGAAGR